MKSHYGQYLKERENFEIIEDERGFATYIILGEECYLRDIWIAPEFRKSGVGRSFCDEVEKIAKANGCKYLTGTVVPNTKGATGNMVAVIKCGFKIHSSTHEKIVLIKEII